MSELLNNRATRKELAKQSFEYFIAIYFSHFLQYKTPAFHREIIKLITSDEPSFSCIVSFRGSAKSTLCSLILPIWKAICTENKKLILIVCRNQNRANQTLYNIREELESNELLIKDFGPFVTAETSEWNSGSLVLKKQKARISAVSVSEPIRGTIHGANRPDLIIADDIEDVQSAKTLEQRDKLWQFVNGELIPIGNPGTSYIFIGNLVHKDSVMMRFKQSIQSGKRIGTYREYPFLNDDGKCLWKSIYPDQKAIDRLKHSLTEIDFAREYMLKAINTNEQIIKPKWIHHYDQLPDIRYLDYQLISIDPAFSLAPNAAKTAIVCASMYKLNGEKIMYIHKWPFNDRVSSDTMVSIVKSTYQSMGVRGAVKINVEQAGQQGLLVELLTSCGLPALGQTVKGKDKETRLWAASNQIKNGQVLFPREGAEELIDQILTFGSDNYFDLVDAFTAACEEHRAYLIDCPPIIDFI